VLQVGGAPPHHHTPAADVLVWSCVVAAACSHVCGVVKGCSAAIMCGCATVRLVLHCACTELRWGASACPGLVRYVQQVPLPFAVVTACLCRQSHFVQSGASAVL
jgi:hypothetical protein